MREQKKIGLAMAVLGLATLLIETDATFALIMVPLGVWLLVSKKKLIY